MTKERQATKSGVWKKIGRLVLDKVLLLIEIMVGYIALAMTGAVGVWVVWGRFASLGQIFKTHPTLYGPHVLLASLVQIVLFTAVVYGLQRLHRQTLRDLGVRTPSIGWPRFLILGILVPVLGQGTLLVAQKLIGSAAQAETSQFDLSTLSSVLGWIGVGWVHGGMAEELLFRGFLFARFEALFGKKPWSTVLAVLLLVVFFGLGHAYQGVAGIVLTAISSLAFWGAYLGSKRNLWVSIVAHGCWDTIGWLLML